MRLLAGVAAPALLVLGSASAEGLPGGPVEEALARHRLPAGSLSVFVQDAGGAGPAPRQPPGGRSPPPPRPPSSS